MATVPMATQQNLIQNQDVPAVFESSQFSEACHHAVEEMARLVDTIKQWQDTRRNNQELIASGRFATSEDLNKAESYTRQIDDWVGKLWQRFIEVTTQIPKHFIDTTAWLHSQIAPLDEALVKWKYEQRISLMGGPADNVNDHLANLKNGFYQVESVACALQKQINLYLLVIDNFCKTYSQCEKVIAKCRLLTEEGHKRLNEVKHYAAKLVLKSFIVYEQPPAVVRRSGNVNGTRCAKNSKIPFSMEIRFLAGEKSGLLRENLEMEASLISEQQARDIVEGSGNLATGKITAAGKMSHPVCTLQAPCAATDGYMSAKFVGARVQMVDKAAEDDASRVMYHVLFRAKQKRTANGAFSYYPFWAISLPFSVVINANRQERYKRALMFWHVAFLIDDRTSLSKQFDEKTSEKTGRISWPHFFNALNLWFKNFGQIMVQGSSNNNEAPVQVLQRGLIEHEIFIKEKLGFKEGTVTGNGVTWDMLYRFKAGPNAPTFWEWIYQVAEYVSRYPSCWESGLLWGFASRGTVEHWLSQARESSMVLKFSDSRPGKMVASYISWTGQNKTTEHVIFDEEDDPVFVGKSLIECIRMSAKLQGIKKILPINKPVAELYALENVQRKPEKNDGYVKPGIIFVWGEPPTPPDYQTEIQPNVQNNDNSSGETNSTNFASIGTDLASYPALQEWLQSPSNDNSVQSPQSNNFQSPSSIESNNQYDYGSPQNFQQSPQQQYMPQGDGQFDFQNSDPFNNCYQQPVETMVEDLSLQQFDEFNFSNFNNL